MPVINRIAADASELTEWRRDLHAHPELGLEERRTSQVVADKLASWGIEVTRDLAGTGLVGTLKVGTSARSIGIRADMDCLPMTEENDFPHKSTTPGRMHACGHDGHTTMLLGAAKYLAETRNFDGTVHFIFQPAEENAGGGRIMVEEGRFQRFPCERVFGAHNDTALPVGTITAVAGSVRTLRPDVQDEVERLIPQIVNANATAAAHGATATIDYKRGYPPVVNNEDAADRAARAGAKLLGAERVLRQRPPTMGGEDFSYMAQAVPGCFVRIGQADGDRFTTQVHHPKYDFNDAILPIGASFWATLVEQELARD